MPTTQAYVESKVYKLGSGAWKKIKQKTKKRVKEIAFNLINVYAKRRMNKGFAAGPDTYLQHELEASFVFEDTPDQRTATEAVKQDMEDQKPMDRLICGDVGFGKTEVAIRAAFKAVDNGKQVAVLVPTTILAFQHHNTFVNRLKDFPVTVDYLNRFRSTKQKKEVLEGIGNVQAALNNSSGYQHIKCSSNKTKHQLFQCISWELAMRSGDTRIRNEALYCS